MLKLKLLKVRCAKDILRSTAGESKEVDLIAFYVRFVYGFRFQLIMVVYMKVLEST